MENQWIKTIVLCAVFFITNQVANAESAKLANSVVDYANYSCLVPLGYTQVRTPEDLQNIQNNLSGKYFVCNDIDMTGFSFKAIGSWSQRFNGVLAGNNRVIQNLSIRDSKQRVGMFDTTGPAAIIRDLKLINVVVENTFPDCSPAYGTDCGRSGAVAGANFGAIIRVSVDGRSVVRGHRAVGSLVGTNYGTVSRSNSGRDVLVQAQGYAGGLVGNNYKSYTQGIGLVADSFSEAAVTVETHTAGGLVGSNGYAGTILRSYAAGDVLGGDTLGALVGEHFGAIINGVAFNALIENSYAAEESELPLVGNPSFFSVINNSYTYPISGMTAVPIDVGIYMGWDFIGIWTHEVNGQLPQLR